MTDEEMDRLLYGSEESLNEYDSEIKAYIRGLRDRIHDLLQILDDIHSNTTDYSAMSVNELHYAMDRIADLALEAGIGELTDKEED